jgi:predicted nuclease with RNAse H fold
MKHILFGINYGSKLCGNTVIAILNINKIYFLHVDADTDADEFIVNATNHFKPDVVFLNAPLSLPARCCGKKGNDFHFRKADVAIKAISPMFLGGVAARAMELKARLEESKGTKVYETHTKTQACNYKLIEEGYKKDDANLIACRNTLKEKLSPQLFFDCQDIKTWEHLDAMLSLFSAMRFVMGHADTYGDTKEGLIYI